MPAYVGSLEFVNADLIAQGLSPFAAERAAFAAGRIMLERVEELSRQGLDFAFETTLSGKSLMGLFRTLKEREYCLNLTFLWIPTVEMSLERVAARVRQGGHNIPEQTVRRRFKLGIQNLFTLYRPVIDIWAVWDNSRTPPSLIAREERGLLTVENHEAYSAILNRISNE